MIVPRYYEDLKIMHENTLPPRAYYIPSSKQEADPVSARTASDESGCSMEPGSSAITKAFMTCRTGFTKKDIKRKSMTR